MEDRTWHSRANCKGKSELMFNGDVPSAIDICKRCPVFVECQKESVQNEEHFGVWGGLIWEARMFMCPVCGIAKLPMKIACDDHIDERGEYLIEKLDGNDESVDRASRLSTQTNPDCPLPQYVSHHTGRAYRAGCKCEASLAKALEYIKRTNDKKKREMINDN